MSSSQWFWLIALSILWGASFFFVGVAVGEIPTLTLVFIRVALAAVVLLPVLYAHGLALPTTLSAWAPFAGMALFNNILPFTFITAGQSQIASGLASVLNATTPLWTVVIARLFTPDEPLTASRIGGIVLGITGVAILMAPAMSIGKTTSLFGMGCVLAGAISYGCAGVWGRRLRTSPPLVTATSQLLCSSAVLLPVCLIADAPWTLPAPSVVTIGALVGLAVLSTALAYILFFHILAVSGPTNVMLVTLLIPVSSILLGTLILGEKLLPHHLAGALVIGMALVVFDGRAVGWVQNRFTHAER